MLCGTIFINICVDIQINILLKILENFRILIYNPHFLKRVPQNQLGIGNVY